MSTLMHGDLLAALVELPAMKVEHFSLTLGVPKRIIDEARENHPHDVGRIKSEAISWWLANETTSWDAIATALETPGVDERNLAKKIRSQYYDGGQSMPIPHHDDNYPTDRSPESSKRSISESEPKCPGPLKKEEDICELAEIPHKRSSLPIPNPVVRFSELNIDEQEDLQAQIENLKLEIHRKFLRFEAELVSSLNGRITAASMVRTLMNHFPECSTESMYNVSLLQEHKQELLDAKDIEGVFAIIYPYYSYYNYELLQTIVEAYGSEEDKERMQQYICDFTSYCKRVPCVEFYDDHCQKSPKRVKLKFKLDYDKKHLTLADIKNIQRNISKLLNIRPSVLFLHSVGDGCTAITFLVPGPCIHAVLKLVKEKATILQREVKMMTIECDGKLIDEVCVPEIEIEKNIAHIQSAEFEHNEACSETSIMSEDIALESTRSATPLLRHRHIINEGDPQAQPRLKYDIVFRGQPQMRSSSSFLINHMYNFNIFPIRCNRRCFFWIHFLLIVTTALTIMEMDQTYSLLDRIEIHNHRSYLVLDPGDSRLLPLSVWFSVFHSSIDVELTGDDLTTSAYLYVVDSSLILPLGYNNTALVEEKHVLALDSYRFWKFYLNSNSTINGTVCTSEEPLETFIIKGYHNMDNWRRIHHYSKYVISERHHLVSNCQNINYTISEEDYYFVVVFNRDNAMEPVVNVKLNFIRFQYSYSGSPNCTLILYKSCSVSIPLPYSFTQEFSLLILTSLPQEVNWDEEMLITVYYHYRIIPCFLVLCIIYILTGLTCNRCYYVFKRQTQS